MAARNVTDDVGMRMRVAIAVVKSRREARAKAVALEARAQKAEQGAKHLQASNLAAAQLLQRHMLKDLQQASTGIPPAEVDVAAHSCELERLLHSLLASSNLPLSPGMRLLPESQLPAGVSTELVIADGLGEVEELLQQQAREAHGRLRNGMHMPPAQHHELSQRADALTSLLQGMHALQAVVSSMSAGRCAVPLGHVPSASSSDSRPIHVVVCFMSGPLVQLPPSRLRDSYISYTVDLLVALTRGIHGDNANSVGLQLVDVAITGLVAALGESSASAAVVQRPVRQDAVSDLLMALVHRAPWLGELTLQKVRSRCLCATRPPPSCKQDAHRSVWCSSFF